MVLRSRLPDGTSHLTVRQAVSARDFDLFGRVAEAGYEAPGLAWLQENQGGYESERVVWAIVFDGDQPIGTACGFADTTPEGSIGGVYFVATPPEFRGRGAAAEVTRWVSNRLFDRGVEAVVLQSSDLGFRIYERLGFETYDCYQRVSFGLRREQAGCFGEPSSRRPRSVSAAKLGRVPSAASRRMLSTVTSSAAAGTRRANTPCE